MVQGVCKGNLRGLSVSKSWVSSEPELSALDWGQCGSYKVAAGTVFIHDAAASVGAGGSKILASCLLPLPHTFGAVPEGDSLWYRDPT